jgi:hypothetical protein
MYQLWCEYDYGQEYMFFKSEDDARFFLNQQVKEQGDDWTGDELWDDGLAGLEPVEIYERP